MGRRSRWCWIASALLLALAGAVVVVQDSADFLAAARRAATAFRQRAAAVRAGYRPLGPESPAMGQHWVHPGLLLADHIQAERPAILAYATVAGEPRLVGVAYVVAAGAPVPTAPAPRAAWHVHDGTVLAEAVQPDHDAHGAGHLVPAGVAVLHAWIAVPNPAGPFASDNWALPFVTAGLDPPPALEPDAARGLALARFAAFFAEQDGRDPAALERAGDAVRRWLGARADGPLSAAELHWLARAWRAATVPPTGGPGSGH